MPAARIPSRTAYSSVSNNLEPHYGVADERQQDCDQEEYDQQDERHAHDPPSDRHGELSLCVADGVPQQREYRHDDDGDEYEPDDCVNADDGSPPCPGGAPPRLPTHRSR